MARVFLKKDVQAMLEGIKAITKNYDMGFITPSECMNQLMVHTIESMDTGFREDGFIIVSKKSTLASLMQIS